MKNSQASNIHSRFTLSGQVHKKNSKEINSNPMSNNESLNNSNALSLTGEEQDSKTDQDFKRSQSQSQKAQIIQAQLKRNSTMISKKGDAQVRNKADKQFLNAYSGSKTSFQKDVSFGHEDSIVNELATKNNKDTTIQSPNNEISLNSSNNFNLLTDQLRLSKSGKNTPKKKLADIKDFQAAYKKLANSILQQIVYEKHGHQSIDGSKLFLDESSIRGPLTDRQSTANNSRDLQTQRKRRESSNIQMLLLSERQAVSFIQEESQHEKSSTSQGIHERLYNEHKILKEKQSERERSKIDEKLAECTFKPQLSECPTSGMNSVRRSYNDFFTDQIKFKETREKKVSVHRKILEEKELQECKNSFSRTRQADLSQNNSGVNTVRSNKEVHERLFKQNIKNVKQSNHQTRQEGSLNGDESFTYKYVQKNDQALRSPRMNSIEISKKLYEDALKRKEDKSKNNSREPIRDQKYKTSLHSNQAYARRIQKQVDKAYSDIGCNEEQGITFDNFVDLLKYLGYAGDDLFQKERILKDAWKQIGGDDQRSISKKSFTIFISALNNVYLPWMSECIENQELETPSFYIKQEQEVAQIHYKFFSFWEYRQKMKLNNNSSLNISREAFRSRDINASLSYSFKPDINQKSQKIASQNISQLQSELEQLNIPYNHQDYLIKKGEQIKLKQKEFEEQVRSKQIEGCTFKPQTNLNTSRHREKTVYEDLYSLKDKVSQRRSKNFIDADFEKEKDNCTFKPDLRITLHNNKFMHNNFSKANISPVNQSKQCTFTKKYQQQNSTLSSQMRNNNPFRKQQVNCKQNAHKQVPYQQVVPVKQAHISSKSQLSRKKSSDQIKVNAQLPDEGRLPLLFLDINLGNGQQSRLVVYEGDDPDQVATQFVNVNNLDQGKKQKLLTAIKQQLIVLAGQD